MRRNSPCLATKQLDNYTLVPFQVVPPVLPCCLHLKIISMSSFYHIVLAPPIPWHHKSPLTSSFLPPFCPSSSAPAPCLAFAPWLCFKDYCCYFLWKATCLYPRAATPATLKQTRGSLVGPVQQILSWTFPPLTWSRRVRLTCTGKTRVPSKPVENLKLKIRCRIEPLQILQQQIP